MYECCSNKRVEVFHIHNNMNNVCKSLWISCIWNYSCPVGFFFPPSIFHWNPFTECFNTSLPKILLRNCSAGDDSGSAVTVAQVESRGDVLLWYLLGRNLELNCDSLECDFFFFFSLKVRLCYPLMIHRLQSRYTEHCNRYTEHRADHAQHWQAAYKWARKEWDHWGINTTTKEVMKGLPAQLC